MSDPSIVAHSIFIDYPIALTGPQQSVFGGLANKITAGRFARDSGGLTYVTAVQNASFEIKAGDRVGLIGRNGAGKSTLLKALAGVLPPTRGHLKIRGTSANILQLGAGMDGDLTGFENIERMSRLLEIPSTEWKRVKADVEEFTELGRFLALPVRTYSAGMSMRLSFAMATSYPRDILVVDEVIGAGDMFFVDKAAKRIESFTEQAKILIMASHGHGTLQQFCNRAIFLESGHIVASGSVDEVWAAYQERGDV